jgi:hypothetical protein
MWIIFYHYPDSQNLIPGRARYFPFHHYALADSLYRKRAGGCFPWGEAAVA